jgi:hypothetical protein
MQTSNLKVLLVIFLCLSLSEKIFSQIDTIDYDNSNIKFIDLRFSGDSNQVFVNEAITNQLYNGNIVFKGEINDIVIMWDLIGDSNNFVENEFFSYLLGGYDND